MRSRVQSLRDGAGWSESSRLLTSTSSTQSHAGENTASKLPVGMDHASSSPSHSVGLCRTPLSTSATAAESATKSCSSAGCATPGTNVEPLIVFDWDDTMLPSSWIQLRELLQADCNEDLPAEARRELAILEQSAMKCIANARGLGTVIIITNAESGWVQLSAAKFFVNLLPLLEGVPVVSARSLFEGQFPGSPLCWKSAAFAYMMHDHFLDRSRWSLKTVVSIGDSNEEKMAMRIASGQHSAIAAKSVKFITGPNPEALMCQLDFVTQHLESIVFADSDVEIILEPSMINDACSVLPLHARGLCEANDLREGPTPESKSKLEEERAVDENQRAPHARSSSSVVSKARQSQSERHAVAAPASRPIPIPGKSRGVVDGGGDCVQPFHATGVDVGGALSRSDIAAASEIQGAALAVLKLEGEGVQSVMSGGAASDGGGACGGRTCPADGDGGVKDDGSSSVGDDDGLAVLDEVNIAASAGRRGAPSPPCAIKIGTSCSEIDDSGGTEPDTIVVTGFEAGGVGSGGEEGVFEFEDYDAVMATPDPMI